ncbi:unnamed protein product [Ectocarpus sp. 12 AP-2014]
MRLLPWEEMPRRAGRATSHRFCHTASPQERKRSCGKKKRLRRRSRCFCGCSYKMHVFRRGYTLPVCKICECQGFDSVPSRPEEIGEWWLPRRPGFDASSWRAKCRCGHTHEAHHPVRRTCGSCKCGEFYSAYGCVVCEARQEDHQTQVETAEERVSAGRAVGRDYIPLSQSPQLSEMTFGRRNRRSSASPRASTPTATGAATDGDDGVSRDTPGRGPPSSSLPSVTIHGQGRWHFESSSLAVVAAGAGAGTTARRASSGTPSSAVARQATIISPGQGERPKQRHLAGGALSSGGAAGLGEYDPTRSSDDYSSSGKNTASASPELLYASGRITAARYHEMLQEMNRSGSRPGLAGGPGARTSRRHGAAATVTFRGVGYARRLSQPEHQGS